MVLALTTTAIGFAFDAGSGNKELSAVFAAAYVLGCLAAVLAVRQSGVFTAVIQPPLILFAAVPSAYFLFHSGQIEGFKDLAINCGYPLVERFPLMFFTSAGVLLIGVARWYYGVSTRRSTPRATKDEGSSLKSAVTSKMSSLRRRDTDDEDDRDDVPAPPPRRKRTTDRPSRAATDKPRAAARTTTSRSRRNRAPETEIIEPVADRPRRSSRSTRTTEPPAEPRRRPRPSSSKSSSNPRKSTPPADRSYERPPRRRRFDDYEPLEPHGTNGNGNGNGTHHPVSRVRYRGAEETPAPRRRTPRDYEPDAWKYDI